MTPRRNAGALPWRRNMSVLSGYTSAMLRRGRWEARHEYHEQPRTERRMARHPPSELERLHTELHVWPECPKCGGTHRSDLNYFYCETREEHGRRVMALLAVPWNPKGTREPLVVMEGWEEWDKANLWPAVREVVLERDRHLCQRCGRAEEKVMRQSTTFGLIADGVTKDTRQEVHHIIPRHRGGSDHPRNLMTLCYRCHMRTLGNGYKRGIAPGFEPTLESFDGHAGG